MLLYAIKMLMGDRAKYIGIILGLTFASFIITQQSGIFIGLMTRTFGFVTDTSQPDIWVMDPKVQFIDDIKPLKDTDLFRVRGIQGVDWAVPLYKGLLRARLPNGNFQTCNLIGIDEATLIGGPPEMLQGQLKELRNTDAIIVDIVGAEDKLASSEKDDDGKPIPLKVGETLEINDHRSVVVGICRNTRTFQSQPVIYTTYSRATLFAPRERKLLSFILVKGAAGLSPQAVCDKIRANTGLAAYTNQQFKRLTVDYFIENTGIPINFGIAVLLGFIIGTAIAGQTFYNFALDNLRYFGTFKAMGASSQILIKMVLLQALMVGAIGWGLGIALTSLFAISLRNTELSFLMPWQLLLGSALAIFMITLFGAFLSLWKILKLEPAIVFKT